MIHQLILFLLTSPLNGYASYRLFIGTLNRFMLLQIGLWLFEIGTFSLIYCIIVLIQTEFFQFDREFYVICYFLSIFIFSLVGSYFSHPLIVFLNKTENSDFNSKSSSEFQKNYENQDEILHKNGFKKIEIQSDEIEEEIFESIEKVDDTLNFEKNPLNDVEFEESEADSEKPFISDKSKKLNASENNFVNHSKIEYKRRYKTPIYFHPLVRCFFNSLLISIVFLSEFLFFIQKVLFRFSNFSCLLILIDLISTLSFSVFINSYQIRKQIKYGNFDASSLFSSSLLSGPFLFVFSLIFYVKNREKNPFISLRCFAAASSFFCISLSFIFSSLTFIIIFALFINQNKARNGMIYRSF